MQLEFTATTKKRILGMAWVFVNEPNTPDEAEPEFHELESETQIAGQPGPRRVGFLPNDDPEEEEDD